MLFSKILKERIHQSNIQQLTATETYKLPFVVVFCILEEIVSALTCKPLITEIVKPQIAYTHDSVKEIIEDVAHSSVMRLDPVSMAKLWDLITMVFKWQVSMSDQIIDITLRHLYEIENYVTSEETQLQLHRVQQIIENFNKVLNNSEKMSLHDDISYWLKDFNVRVSLFLRMGLQNMDGDFILKDLNPIAEEMLRNLGENIYQVTQNGRILENKREDKNTEENVNELDLFASEMLGERKLSSGSTEKNANILKLSINEGKPQRNTTSFDKINVNVNDNNLQDLMNEMSLNDDSGNSNIKDDLLNMIGGSDDNENLV